MNPGRQVPFLVLALVLPVTLLGADGPRWRWSNPTPHGNHVYDMVTGFGLTIQACDRGQLYASSDLAFWEPLNSGTTNALRGAAFLGERLLITGENGTFLWADSLAAIQTATVNPPTTDWIEGVAVSPTRAVAVGDNGAIYSTITGTNWTRVTTGFTAWLSSVTYGASKFVAVGENGFVASSPNGSDWITRTIPTTKYLYRVRYLGGSFWALGESGACFRSSDAITWAAVSTGATNGLFDVAANVLSLLVVGDAEVRSSPIQPSPVFTDELDPGSSNRPARWTYYAANGLTSGLLISGRSGMTVQGYHTNVSSALDWVSPSEPVRNWLWDVLRLPDLYVAVGDLGTLLTSAGGINWSLELPPTTVTNAVLLGLSGDTNGLFAVGSKGNIIYSPSQFTNVVSTNASGVVITNQINTIGTLWRAAANSPTTNDLQGAVVFGPLRVTCGAAGTVLVSTNGATNWSAVPSPTTSHLSSLATLNGTLVAVGANGAILSSTDATNWTSHKQSTTNWIYRVRNLDGRLHAVGENGVLYVSDNGTSWNLVATGTSRWLNDIVRLNDTNQTYFIVGNQGAVLSSTNGTSWTPAATITGKSLSAAAHDGAGQLLAVGYEGSVLRSQVIAITNAPTIASYARKPNQSVFLISGRTDQLLTLDRSSDYTNFVNWVTGPLLEILDDSGTILYVESNSTNDPPIRNYRVKLAF